MHFCLLCGYGANAVNPYLAMEAVHEMNRRGEINGTFDTDELVDHFIAAIKKGILKVMSKMGISTLRSYFAAQLFEAIGLNHKIIDSYFTGTASRISGVGLDVLAQEAIARHEAAFAERPAAALELDFGGEYHYRADGENHLWN